MRQLLATANEAVILALDNFVWVACLGGFSPCINEALRYCGCAERVTLFWLGMVLVS